MGCRNGVLVFYWRQFSKWEDIMARVISAIAVDAISNPGEKVVFQNLQ